MDLNDIRSIVTVLSLVLFVGIVGWTWSRSRRADFEEAAALPFKDEDIPRERQIRENQA